MRCEKCGRDEAALHIGLMGPFSAELCAPCMRKWRAVLGDYQELVVRFHKAVADFDRARGGRPSTTGLGGELDLEEAFHELRQCEAVLLEIWEEWLNATPPSSSAT